MQKQEESNPEAMQEELDQLLSLDLVAITNLPDHQLADSSAQSRYAHLVLSTLQQVCQYI
jgi:hypothetical protein